MTREEMVGFFYKNCKGRSCIGCPMHSENCDVSSMSDKELIRAIEILTNETRDEKEKTVAQECDSAPCEKERKPIHMVTIRRDELCALRGRLLMLSCCSGVTITNAMADELLFMVETIDEALKESEDILG